MKSTVRSHPHPGGARSFRYEALRRDGSRERGWLVAPDRTAAAEELAQRDLLLIAVQPDSRVTWRWKRRLTPRELSDGLRILASLVEAGLPIRRMAASFGSLAPAAWGSIAASLEEGLSRGRSLSAVFGDARQDMPIVVVSIIRAGEAAGTLAPALIAAADLAEGAAQARASIRAALAYPLVLTLAGAASAFILVGLVLPRFAAILSDLGEQLPPTTQFVLNAAQLCRELAMPVGIIMVVFTALARRWHGTPEGGKRVDEALLSLWGVGGLRHSIASARVASALGALLSAGVSLPAALAHAGDAGGDRAVAARMSAAREAVIAGRGLGSSLEAVRALTPGTVRLIRAGEESGRLPAMLTHAARLEAAHAARAVQRLVGLLEPTLILVFAAGIAIVAAALLQAVYSVRPG